MRLHKQDTELHLKTSCDKVITHDDLLHPVIVIATLAHILLLGNMLTAEAKGVVFSSN